MIVDQGDSQGKVIVLKGSLECRNTSAGGEPTLRVFGPGEFTGEVNVLSGRRTLVRIQAREAGTLLEINRVDLRRIMLRRMPRWVDVPSERLHIAPRIFDR